MLVAAITLRRFTVKASVAHQLRALLDWHAVTFRSKHTLIEDPRVDRLETIRSSEHLQRRRSKQIRTSWLLNHPRSAQEGLHEEHDGEELQRQAFLAPLLRPLFCRPLSGDASLRSASRRSPDDVDGENEQLPEDH